MALGEYQAALKLGRRQYQEAVLMGKSPYLPVLDEILEGKDIVAEVSLGVMDIMIIRSKKGSMIRSLHMNI